MADIFLSYSSKHRNLTSMLAQAIEAEGFSVWWDIELEAYATFRDQIDAALSQARVVVVIWSEGAAASDYVVAEAREALAKGGKGDQGRLVNTLAPGFDPWRIPKPMGEFQAEQVENLDAVVKAIMRRWAGERPERLNAAGFYERATTKPALSPKRDTISMVGHVTPALLLNVRLALAPYLDVHGLRAEMATWASEGRPVRGRLVHGPGGLGKTRLMVEVTADLRAHDWVAGFVETPSPDEADMHRQAIDYLIDSDQHAGLMLVLDYAERRQEEAARYAERMVKAAQRQPGRPLRLVLLSRGAGEWWDRTIDDTPALQAAFGGTGSVIQLSPVTDPAQRERLFKEAAQGFREAIARIRAEDPSMLEAWTRFAETTFSDAVVSALPTDAFARPLMIQIAALLSLQGETPETLSVAALLDAMLGVERKYWKSALGTQHSDTRQIALARGAIQSTLAGGVERSGAQSLLIADKHFTRAAPADVAEALSDLERIYGDAAGGLVALEPDLVGEHLAAADGDEHLLDACFNWAGEDQEKRRTILTVLNRATRGEHGGKSRKARQLLTHAVSSRGAVLAVDLIAVALETPGDLPAILRDVAPTLQPDLAAALSEAIPMQSLLLMGAALPLAQRAATWDADASADDDSLNLQAGRKDHLGKRFSNVGRRGEALIATQAAVGIRRELYTRNADAFGADLALSLNNLGNALSDLGRREEALAATQEAVVIRKELYARNSNAFGPDLAASLNSLGNALSALGRREEALIATQEAVMIRRELDACNSDAFGPRLAASLTNLGVRFSELGRREEALSTAQEAVGIYRDLYTRNTDAFGADLAASLNNFGNALWAFGHRKEALTATREAVEICWELYARNSDAFGHDLAVSLCNLGIRFSGLGRREEGLSAAQEAVRIYRELYAHNADAFGRELAASLTNLGVRLSDFGRHEEALIETQEAVGIYRELYARNSDAFGPELAASLSNLGVRFSDLGRHAEGLSAAQEAVGIYRKLCVRNTDAFRADLAVSLSKLGYALLDFGRREEALIAMEEAVGICRELCARNTDAFVRELAGSLNNLGNALSELGRREAALIATQEAVDIYRELYAHNADAFGRELAGTLDNMGELLTALGCHGEALRVSQEALEIYRKL